ncbi:MAG: sugar phosphate isomerase/epimerase family protein [Planctomycetota bacterium]
MRIAQSTIGFQAKHLTASSEPFPTTVSELVPLFVELGWQGIEIWEPHVAELERDELAALGTQIREAGLTVPMLSSYYNFTKSPEHAAESLANGHRVLYEARLLGARSLRIFTGNHRSADASPEQWGRCASCLRELCDSAADDGISLSLHMHDWNLADTVAGTLRLLELVDRDNCRVLSKPAIYHPDHLAVHDALMPHLEAIHLTAGRTVDGQNQRCTLAESDLDWEACIGHLHDHGFTGWLILNWMGSDALRYGRDSAVWLRGVLEGLG